MQKLLDYIYFVQKEISLLLGIADISTPIVHKKIN